MKVIFPNFIKEDNKNVWKLPMQSANFQIIFFFVIQSKISGERYATGGSLFLSVCRYVRNKSFFISMLLHFSWHLPDIHNHPVHVQHPY